MSGKRQRYNKTSRAAATSRVPAQRASYAIDGTSALAVSSVVEEELTQREAAQIALRSLRTLAPLMHDLPDVQAEMRHVLTMAEARRVALATGNAYTGIGTPSPDPRTLRGMSFSPDILRGGSPTGSTPMASSPAGYLGGWAGAKDAPKGVLNAKLLRNFSQDPWVFAAKKHRAERVARADIDVLPLDPDRSYDKLVQKRMKRLLNCPNEYRDSYTSLIKRVIDDVLTLDRGCISKAMTPKRQPTGLYSEDGATIKIYANWNGDPRVPRYLYEEPGSTHKVPLRNDELICIMESEATYRFGYSRLQALLDDIEADIQATQSAKNFVLHKPAQHAIQIQGAGDQAIKQLRADYEALVAGKREILFMGGDGPMNAKPLVFSLKDNQFMEWQEYLARKICAVFQVSPQSIGLTFQINKATAESQQDIEDDAGNIPLLLLLEEYLNRELMWDFAALSKDDGRPDFESLNLGIFFTEVSEASRIMHVERLMGIAKDGLAGAPFLTPNMALAMLGEEPIAGGNTLWFPTQTNGMMPWLTYDGETGDFAPAYLGGELGGQEPGSGPDEDERELDDTRQEKPPQQSAPTTGDETSGNGAQPNLPTDGDGGTTAADAGSGGASKAARSSRRKSGGGTRQPGKAWRPASYEDAPLPAVVPMRRSAVPVAASPALDATLLANVIAQAMGAMVPTLVAALSSLDLTTLATNHPHHRARRANAPEQGEGPEPVRRVTDVEAQSHHQPHEETVARAQISSAVKTVFERAASRGHAELTQQAHEAHQGQHAHSHT